MKAYPQVQWDLWDKLVFNMEDRNKLGKRVAKWTGVWTLKKGQKRTFILTNPDEQDIPHTALDAHRVYDILAIMPTVVWDGQKSLNQVSRRELVEIPHLRTCFKNVAATQVMTKRNMPTVFEYYLLKKINSHKPTQ